MLLLESSSTLRVKVSYQNLVNRSKSIVVYRFQQSRRFLFVPFERQATSRVKIFFGFAVMFLSRCCYGETAGATQLKRNIMNSSPGTSLFFSSEQPQRRRQGISYFTIGELKRELFFQPHNKRYMLMQSSIHNVAFITTSMHQSFFSSQAKQSRSTNRWRTPILRPPVAGEQPKESKRPPKLYKRLHNLRSKKSDKDIDDSMPIIDDGKIYRADRVLANRTGKSRKECFQLLKARRVFILKDELYNEVSTKQEENSGDAKMLPDSSSSSPGISVTTGGKADTTNNDIDSTMNNKSSIQQYRLEVITGPAIKIGMHTKLRIDKYQDVPLPPPLLMIYHKPKWLLSVRNDPMGRPCLNDVLLGSSNTDSSTTNPVTSAIPSTTNPSDSADSSTTNNPNATPPLHPVGRLDYDTTGLLLFSSSGPLTQSILHPKHSIEKEYVAVVTGIVNEDELRAVLAAGVTTGEGVHTAQLISASPNTPPMEDVATFLAKIKTGLPTEYNTTDLKLRGYLDIFDAPNLSTISLTVSEGKYRMVRRMLANVGHPVVTLHRARIGEISLGDVPAGETRMLTPTEFKWATKQLKLGGKVLNPTEPTEKL